MSHTMVRDTFRASNDLHTKLVELNTWIETCLNLRAPKVEVGKSMDGGPPPNQDEIYHSNFPGSLNNNSPIVISEVAKVKSKDNDHEFKRLVEAGVWEEVDEFLKHPTKCSNNMPPQRQSSEMGKMEAVSSHQYLTSNTEVEEPSRLDSHSTEAISINLGAALELVKLQQERISTLELELTNTKLAFANAAIRQFSCQPAPLASQAPPTLGLPSRTFDAQATTAQPAPVVVANKNECDKIPRDPCSKANVGVSDDVNRKFLPRKGCEGKIVLVSNLSPDTSKEELEQAFQIFGPINRFKLFKGRAELIFEEKRDADSAKNIWDRRKHWKVNLSV